MNGKSARSDREIVIITDIGINNRPKDGKGKKGGKIHKGMWDLDSWIIDFGNGIVWDCGICEKVPTLLYYVPRPDYLPNL